MSVEESLATSDYGLLIITDADALHLIFRRIYLLITCECLVIIDALHQTGRADAVIKSCECLVIIDALHHALCW